MMNFFTIGFALCALNLNMGWETNYVLKLVGVYFMLGGIKEAELFKNDNEKGFSEFRGGVFLMAAAALGGLVQALLIRFGRLGADAGNITSIIFGSVCCAVVIWNQFGIVKRIGETKALVGDPSLIKTLGKAWKKYAIFAGVSVAADVLARLCTAGSGIEAVLNTVMLITRIIMIVYLVSMAKAFNMVRMDFNATHEL